MHRLIKKTCKATIINVIVALLSSFVILLCSYIIFNNEIENAISIINIISLDTSLKEVKITSFDENNTLVNYPEYGTQYANIEIPKIDVDLPVYYGDTLDVLKNGVRSFITVVIFLAKVVLLFTWATILNKYFVDFPNLKLVTK